MIPWTNESVWLDAAPENKSGSLWFIFHGSVILPYILKAIWHINMITWAYESVWFDAWPQNKNGSLWPIFHDSVILRYIFKTYRCINMIPWNNESVWLDALPQNKTVSRWPVFHGSVILPYILKAIWCINMILWANKSVWLDAWPQNKSWSLWPIFHGSVAYILRTILCIRRWHWPGVYVSPCSLALVKLCKHLSRRVNFYTPGIRSMPWGYNVFVFSVCVSVKNFRVRSITLKPLDIFSWNFTQTLNTMRRHAEHMNRNSGFSTFGVISLYVLTIFRVRSIT